MARLEGHEPAHRSDKDLTIAFQHGDDAAFDAIYARHYDRVRATCRRLLGCPSEAEEATQETFLRCYRSLARFNGQYQLGAWVARIATNVCVDMLRSRNRTIALSGIPVEDIDLEAPDKAIELKVEDSLHLTQAMGGIQPLHAKALYLRAIEGLSHEEMAARLGMTPQQVKSLLHRSRSSFRKMWDNASGWAIAPVAGVRSFLAERSRAATTVGQEAVLASPGSALFVEKVAAGTIAIVVAFGGLPTTTNTPDREPSTGRPSTPRIAAPKPLHGTDPAMPSAATGGGQPAADKNPDLAALDVVEEIDRAGRKLERTARDNQPDEPDPNDPVPGEDPNAGAANKEVRKVVREAKETLGNLP